MNLLLDKYIFVTISSQFVFSVSYGINVCC